MSYGASANYADVIEDKSVAKLCPKEWKQLQAEMLNVEDGTHENIQDAYQVLARFERQEEDISKEVEKAYVLLKKAFERKTGLSIIMEYHDCDECGDRYDEVRCAYWAVGGMYELTEAGKEIGDLVERKMFVTYG